MGTFLSDSHMKLSDVLMLMQYTPEAAFFREVEKKSRLMRTLPWYESSDGNIHKGTKATKLPEGAFGAYNKAIPTSNLATTAYEKTMKLYELKSVVDKRFFRNMNEEQANKVRAGKDAMYARGFMQGLAKQIVTCEGNGLDEEKGLLAMRNKLGEYCFSAGGTSNLGSILFIRPDEDGVNIRYPGLAGAGVLIDDVGEVEAAEITRDGVYKGTYRALETDYSCNYLIDVPDDSALIRLANLDTSRALSKTDVDMLIDIVNELPNGGEGYVAYGPQKILGQFWKYLNDKNNIAFSKHEVEGMGVPTHIFNVPFFAEEYMTVNETQIK